MKKIICVLSFFLINVYNVESMKPCLMISFNNKDYKISDIQIHDLQEVSCNDLQILKKELERAIDLLSPALRSKNEKDNESEEITKSDAFLALNGAKMDLKDALERNPEDVELAKRALSTVLNLLRK